MNIAYIETLGDENSRVLIMTIDSETEVVINGYGTGDACMFVRGIDPLNPEYDPTGSVGQDVWEQIAKAIVWASPRTIAHLVMDTINNQ